MKFRVTCPECEDVTTVEVDTSKANDGDVYNDIFVCPVSSCKKPSILETKIVADLKILPVATEPVKDVHFIKRH